VRRKCVRPLRRESQLKVLETSSSALKDAALAEREAEV
jgi:hypothetical protein